MDFSNYTGDPVRLAVAIANAWSGTESPTDLAALAASSTRRRCGGDLPPATEDLDGQELGQALRAVWEARTHAAASRSTPPRAHRDAVAVDARASPHMHFEPRTGC